MQRRGMVSGENPDVGDGMNYRDKAGKQTDHCSATQEGGEKKQARRELKENERLRRRAYKAKNIRATQETISIATGS